MTVEHRILGHCPLAMIKHITGMQLVKKTFEYHCETYPANIYLLKVQETTEEFLKSVLSKSKDYRKDEYHILMTSPLFSWKDFPGKF